MSVLFRVARWHEISAAKDKSSCLKIWTDEKWPKIGGTFLKFASHMKAFITVLAEEDCSMHLLIKLFFVTDLRRFYM
jgi:hypothetical protein